MGDLSHPSLSEPAHLLRRASAKAEIISRDARAAGKHSIATDADVLRSLIDRALDHIEKEATQ